MDHVTSEVYLGDLLQIRYAGRLMSRVCTWINEGALRVGDRVPPDRNLAWQMQITLASVNTGIDYLAMARVLKVRQGTGAIVAMNAEELADNQLAQRSCPEYWDLNCIWEFRGVLERNQAALAAERCRGRYSASLAEELAELYLAVDDPQEYLLHGVDFHRTIAQSVGNPILCALMTKILSAIYDAHRYHDLSRLSLRDSADRHHRIFRAIRDRKPREARKAVEEHFRISRPVPVVCDSAGAANLNRAHLPAQAPIAEAKRI